MQFKTEKGRVLQQGRNSHHTSICWATQLESSLAEKALRVLLGNELGGSQEHISAGKKARMVSGVH